MERRCLLFRWRGGEKRLRVLEEVLRAVRRVEAFGEHDQLGPRLCCLENFGASMAQIGSFIDALNKQQTGSAGSFTLSIVAAGHT